MVTFNFLNFIRWLIIKLFSLRLVEGPIDWKSFLDYLALGAFDSLHLMTGEHLYDLFQLIIGECFFEGFRFSWHQLIFILARRSGIVLSLKQSSVVLWENHAEKLEEAKETSYFSESWEELVWVSFIDVYFAWKIKIEAELRSNIRTSLYQFLLIFFLS